MSVALCMIVRDEAEILPRCLRSVRDLIDTWVICDTGSTDDTRAVIEAELEGIPGALHDTPWVDFGHNRSLLLELARGRADYLLLLDADHTVLQRAALSNLTADAYHLREVGSLDYAVIRLVRGDRKWWYEGSTHEYIATDGRFVEEPLDDLLIEHHADGASRERKFLRDVGLLKRDLADDPENGRSVFYLAQTYRDLGRTQLAIEHYLRRSRMGGWEEEAFYAQFQAGALLIDEVDFEIGVAALLQAWQMRPSRAEPLHALARAHRLRSQHDLAELFAGRGLELDYPSDVLFIHRSVYEWGLALERGLALAGLARYDEARSELEAIVEAGEAPDEVEGEVLTALEELPGSRAGRRARAADEPVRLATVAPSLRIGEVKLDVTPDWPAFNPSIAPDGDGFRLVVRTANYFISAGVVHEEGVLHNINYLVTLDADLAVTAIEPIVDPPGGGPRRYPSRIQGYEDMRLFELDGEWYASATVCDLNPVERREMALLRFDGARISRVTKLLGPDERRHEKNWMPFVRGDQLAFVYSSRPTLVLEADAASGRTRTLVKARGPAVAERFRGSSQGVRVDGGHLFVVHETMVHRAAVQYVHRFALLDDDLSLAGVSAPFSFTSDRVEFCAGMAARGDELVISFGVSDVAAGLAVMDVRQALSMLEPVRRGSVRSGEQP